MDSRDQRVHQVYLRIQKMQRSSRVVVLPLVLPLVVTTLAAIILTVSISGRLDSILSPSHSSVLAGLAVAIAIYVWCNETIPSILDVIMLTKAIKKLRYPEWDPLCFIILNRPNRNRRVLTNPAVIFIIGHLFNKLGFEAESKELIEKAKHLSPALSAITFSVGKALTATDEMTLVSGIEQIVKSNIVFRIWVSKKVRYTVIVIGLIFIVMNVVIQLFKRRFRV